MTPDPSPLTFAFGCELAEESVGQARSNVGSDEHVAIVALVLDHRTNVDALRQNARVGGSFRLATREWAMLAHKVQFGVATRVRPQPSFGAVKSGTVLTSAWQVPKRDGNVFAIDPLPVHRILGVANGSKPVLTHRVVSVATIKFPAEETLQCRRSFVYQRASSYFTEPLGIVERHGLIVVEDVALATVRRRRTKWLVTETGTLFNG